MFEEDNSEKSKKAYNYLLEKALSKLGRKELSSINLIESLKRSVKQRQYLISETEIFNLTADIEKLVNRAKLPLDELSDNEINDLISQVVLCCEENNWCSNIRFTEEKIKSMRQKGHSDASIKSILINNNIDESLIKKHLAVGNSEFKSAVISLKRILHKHKNQNIKFQSQEFFKVINSMVRKGFSSDITYKAWYNITGITCKTINEKLFS